MSEEELKYIKEWINKTVRNMINEEHKKLAETIATEIGELGLSNPEIVRLLDELDAPYALVIVYLYKNLCSVEASEFNNLLSLINLNYKEQYEQDIKSGIIEERLNFDLTHNKRLISKLELMLIGVSLGADRMCYFKGYEGDDPIIKASVEHFKLLDIIKNGDRCYRIEQKTVEAILLRIIDDLDDYRRNKRPGT